MLSRFERFTYNIDEVSLYWHRIAAAEMKRYGLKGSAAVYLVKLLTFPDGLTAAELVSLTGRDKADVSREVGHLEKAGLAVRLAAGSRSYRAPIVLTETGRKVAVAISRKAEQAVDIVGGALTP